MKVTLVAKTVLEQFPESVRNTKFGIIRKSQEDAWHYEDLPNDMDTVAEFAGRACYQSWDMPNPATATAEGYLGNIIEHAHFNVMEHSSVTFYLEDVSRALLAELTRHRHASFSVESQRYVDYSGTEPVIPPAFRGTKAEDLIRSSYAEALEDYELLVAWGLEKGLKRKEAREAARAVLPNCAPVSMVLTGNMRAFRDIFGKRYSMHADAEIRELATELLRQLRLIASASFQDFPEKPFE